MSDATRASASCGGAGCGDARAAIRRAATSFGLQPVQPRAPQGPPARGTSCQLPVPTAARAPRHALAKALFGSPPPPVPVSTEALPVVPRAGLADPDALPDSSDDDAELLAAARAVESRVRLPLAVPATDGPVHPALRALPAAEAPRPPEWVVRVFRAHDPAAAVFAMLGPEARVAARCLLGPVRDACLVAAALDSPRWQCPSAAFLHVAHAAWGVQKGVELARLNPTREPGERPSR